MTSGTRTPHTLRCLPTRFVGLSRYSVSLLLYALQGARLREKSEKLQAAGDDYSEDDDDDDESDIMEELGYISPLDTVDPYGAFKQALTSTFN